LCILYIYIYIYVEVTLVPVGHEEPAIWHGFC
jgi:hypothetical protein